MEEDQIIDEITDGGFDESEAKNIIEIITNDAQTKNPHIEFYALHSKKKEDIDYFEEIAKNNQSVRHILSYNPGSKHYGKTFVNKKSTSYMDHSTHGVDFNTFLKGIKYTYSSLTGRNWPH